MFITLCKVAQLWIETKVLKNTTPEETKSFWQTWNLGLSHPQTRVLGLCFFELQSLNLVTYLLIISPLFCHIWALITTCLFVTCPIQSSGMTEALQLIYKHSPPHVHASFSSSLCSAHILWRPQTQSRLISLLSLPRLQPSLKAGRLAASRMIFLHCE